MSSQFTILEEVPSQMRRQGSHSPVSQREKPPMRRQTSEFLSSRQRLSLPSGPQRRSSVAGKMIESLRGRRNSKTGISAAKEAEIAEEWAQFERDKATQQPKHRSHSVAALPRLPPALPQPSPSPEPLKENEDEVPDLLPKPTASSTPHLDKIMKQSPPFKIMKHQQSEPVLGLSGQRQEHRASLLRSTPSLLSDATDLNILWRVQARGKEGKKTTPEQMAKLRQMLKQENKGSRRSRNSVYQIDPSLLERPGRIREIHSMKEFQERLQNAKEALVCVTFSAKWCGPWRMIKPDVHRLSHIHADVEFYEVDVDENEEIAEARRVACMPTFQFFKRGLMLDKFAEPNRIKLDETIRKLRKMEIRPEE